MCYYNSSCVFVEILDLLLCPGLEGVSPIDLVRSLPDILVMSLSCSSSLPKSVCSSVSVSMFSSCPVSCRGVNGLGVEDRGGGLV